MSSKKVIIHVHTHIVLTKQTYNNQDKYKKPKDIHKKHQKLNLTKPN